MTRDSERGSVLVEFALVSLVLYLLLAAAVDFGRLMFSAQALQDVARVMARELAVTPLPAAITFDGPGQSGALTYVDSDPSSPNFGVPLVKTRVFNPACLVVDLDGFTGATADADLDAFFASMPLANKALRPLMIVDHQGGRSLLRYPGAVLMDNSDPPPTCAGRPAPYTVAIPRVVFRGATGVETVEWIPVIEEIRADPGDPMTGRFSLAPSAVAPDERGLAAIRINYPYQAAMMTGFRANPAGPLEPNVANAIVADDQSVGQTNTPSVGNLLPDDPAAMGPSAGPYGLGRQLAFAGQVVRPFRKLLSAQGIYRREVFE